MPAYTLVVQSGGRSVSLAGAASEWRRKPASSSILSPMAMLIVLFLILCDLSPTVHPSPLPSSSAWSLPTLNYLFKDTKTKSQSTQFQRENSHNNANNNIGESGSHHHRQLQKSVVGGGNSSPSNTQSSSSGSSMQPNTIEGKVSSTGRLISAHDIRLTDNWGWVRRGVSDPAQTTEQRRKQNKNNIRHSKSKHKQRHYGGGPSPSSAFSSTSSIGSRSRKREKMENLLCPFDEIRGPDGKCRKAPRFSLYRVGRK